MLLKRIQYNDTIPTWVHHLYGQSEKCLAIKRDVKPHNSTSYVVEPLRLAKSLILSGFLLFHIMVFVVLQVIYTRITGNILLKYRLYKISCTQTVERMIEDDGREIIVNSGCGWNFTLTEEKLVRITNKVAECTGIAIDNDYGRYYGKAIVVWIYDTAPNGETYLFAFSGDELIYNTKFITAEHFEFVKNLCNEIVQN